MDGLAQLLTSLLLSGIVAFLFAPWVIRAALRWQVLDRPQGYKAHATPTPLLGGLVVAVSTFAGSVWFATASAPLDLVALSALAAGSVVILVTGLVDDLAGMRPAHKFLWQLAAPFAAGSLAAVLGVRLELFLAWPPEAIIVLTVLWIVGITNAFNFLDNMNGSCAGLGAIAAIALSLLNWHSGETHVALAAAALAGACLGFLPFNWPSARIFLGDTGSMFIGFSLALISVMGVYTRGAEVPALAVFAPLLALGVPLLDAVLVVLLRLRAHEPPWVGDRRHLNHRLVRCGMQPRDAVLTLWVAGAACGAVAVAVPLMGVTGSIVLVVALLGGLGFLVFLAGTEGLS